MKFVIWTTTPWTLPANVAIALNKDLDYVQVRVNDTSYIVAQALLDNVCDAVGWDKEGVQIEKTFKGADLEFVKARHPFIDRESLIILGDHVTTDAGTGCVHTAPGHGEDDFIIGQKYELDVISPVDGKGVYTSEAGEFEGMYYDKANKVITEKLEASGHLLKLDFFKHSYPHDWRTKKPVIFRATPQWFASINKVRQDILDAIEETEFKVDWGKTRIYNMIRDRGDWVISRQRVWGVPLPVFYAENGDIIMDKAVIEHVATLVEKHGQTSGTKEKRKIYCQKGLHIQVVRTEYLQKKRISWTFGLTQVHLTVVYWKRVRNYRSQLICTSKGVTSIVDGSTHRSQQQLLHVVSPLIRNYYRTVS